MPYCTVDDIRNQVEEARLVQLTDDEGAGVVAVERVSRAISDADEEINSYLGMRMRVPLDPAPEAVRRLSVDLALYNLYSRRENIPENRSERYRNAIRILEKAAAGKISLGRADPQGNPLDPDRSEASDENPLRFFTRSTLAGF